MHIEITVGDKLVAAHDMVSNTKTTQSTTSNNASSTNSASSVNTTNLLAGASTATNSAAVNSATTNMPSSVSAFQQTLSNYTGKTIGAGVKTTDLQTVYTLEDSFQQASREYGVNVNLLKAIAKQESNFDVNSRSASGAVGIMQLMPATALSLGVIDPADPHQNIMAGAKYISEKLTEFGGNLNLALAAYNAGSGAVKRAGGVPASAADYVNKVTNYYRNGVTVTDNNIYHYQTATKEQMQQDINTMLAAADKLGTGETFKKVYNEAIEDYKKPKNYDDLSEAERAYNKLASTVNSSVLQMIEKLT